MDFELARSLATPATSKIVLLVMDGLGGHPRNPDGRTELEAAATPNLDRLAAEGVCGLHVPVGPGITPGSGPSHLGLFGYDPLEYQVGRGVLSALGIGFDLRPGDVAARGNFCTLDGDGLVSDRRAGRLSSERNAQLLEKLRDIELDGAELILETVKEYRFTLILRGDGLGGDLADTDPQETGREPLEIRARKDAESGSEKTARLVRSFLDQVRRILADEHPANMVLLRGFSTLPRWPALGEIYGVRAACIAAYPMYRGLSRLIGMDVTDAGASFESELKTLESVWKDHDFFYLHFKKTDSAGEDGDFGRKAGLIEEVDEQLPRILRLKPDVLAVTGDHSTPAVMQSHSWHPVPTLLWSKRCRPDRAQAFGEGDCLAGGLGPAFPARDLMPLMMANAGRLKKFGA